MLLILFIIGLSLTIHSLNIIIVIIILNISNLCWSIRSHSTRPHILLRKWMLELLRLLSQLLSKYATWSLSHWFYTTFSLLLNHYFFLLLIYYLKIEGFTAIVSFFSPWGRGLVDPVGCSLDNISRLMKAAERGLALANCGTVFSNSSILLIMC